MLGQIRQSRRIRNVLIILLIALPLILKLVLFVDPVAIGCDTRTHVYKAYVLAGQMQALPPSLSGSWDWSWHVGYEFLDAYSPLPYYWIAMPTFLGISIDASLRIMLISFFLIGALGIYFLCQELTQMAELGYLGVILFLYSPAFITTLSEWGNVGKVGAYASAPIALFLAERIAKSKESEDKISYSLLLSIALAFGILNNTAVGLWNIILCGSWIVFRSRDSILKATATFIGALGISIMLSAFFLLPLLSARVTILPVIGPGVFSLPFLSDLIFRGGVLQWVLIGVLSFQLLVPPRRKIDRTLKFFFFFLLLYLIYNLVAISIQDYFPSLSIIRGDRSLIVILIFSSIVPVYLLKLGIKESKTLRLAIDSLMFFIFVFGMIIPPYYPMQAEQYFSAAEYIARDSEWCRYAFLPREPIGAVLPQYSGKSYVDGWSFLSDPEIFSILGTPVSGLERIEKLMAENGTLGLCILEYLGVKYVIVERSDPIYGYNLSEAIYNSINSSDLATLAFKEGSASVFTLSGYESVHAYRELPQDLDPAINWTPPSTGVLKTINVVQTAEELRLELHASYSVYIVIPVVNSDKLETYVNGTKTDTLHAYGNLIGVNLSDGGEYQISIKIRAFQPVRIAGVTISFLALVVMGLSIAVIELRSRNRKNEK